MSLRHLSRARRRSCPVSDASTYTSMYLFQARTRFGSFWLGRVGTQTSNGTPATEVCLRAVPCSISGWFPNAACEEFLY